jgi:hypothetical protein
LVRNPLLKSISTQIHAKVEVLFLEVSRLSKWNFPKAEPMASSKGKPQKCKGRLGSLTQTRVEERMLVVGLKEGVQGFMHKLELPQNHKNQIMIFLNVELNNEKTFSARMNESLLLHNRNPHSRDPTVEIN